MKRDHYSGGLTREQFLFYEMIIVLALVLQGKSRDEIYDEIFCENLFRFPTERMIKSIAKTCFKRIDALDSTELEEVIREKGDTDALAAFNCFLRCRHEQYYRKA